MVNPLDMLPLGNTPSISITANGSVPQTLGKDLVSMKLIDEIGLKSDELTLTVVPGYIRPKGGDKLTINIDMHDYGTFTVVETTRTKTALTIKATAANFNEDLKERKNRSWENIKLCELVAKIAKEHELKSKCNVKVMIDHAAQHYESDLNFLTRLAKKYNIRFNIKNDTILFLTYEEKESEDMPMFYVDLNECSTWSIKNSTKPAYLSCKAQYHDTKENKVKSVIVGKGKPQLLLHGGFNSEREAYDRANAALNNITAGTVSGNFTIYGQEIRAGGLLSITAADEDTGIYTIKKVTHTISSSGYVVVVEFER